MSVRVLRDALEVSHRLEKISHIDLPHNPAHPAPGVFNLITFPFEAFENIRYLFDATRRNDREAIIDGAVRSISSPLLALNGLGALLDVLAAAGMLRIPAMAIASLVGGVAGIIFCGIGIGLEVGLSQQITTLRKRTFLTHINACQEQTKPAHTIQNEALEYFTSQRDFFEETFGSVTAAHIQRMLTFPATSHEELERKLLAIAMAFLEVKYLQVSAPEMQQLATTLAEHRVDDLETAVQEACEKLSSAKTAALVRRIGKYTTNQLHACIPSCINKLATGNREKTIEGLSESRALISNITDKADIKNQGHISGIIALAIFASAIALTIIHAPIALPIALYLIGTGYLIHRYVLHKVHLEKDNGTIEFADLLPDWLKRLLFTQEQIEAPSPKKTAPIEKPFYQDHHHQWKALDKRIQAYI